MKKYKLIKEYPGSPELGYIWDNSKAHIMGTVIHLENHPEFWEEVIEKEYEILSFKTPNNNSLMVGKTIQGWYTGILEVGSNNFRNEEWLLKHKYLIESVKRLSDGEVFTLGDIVNDKLLEKITLAINEKNDVVLHLETLHRAIYLLKDNPLKCKKPLFISEDGYPIYQGEITYGGHIQAKKHSFHASNWNGDSSVMKYFKTKEGLDKYFEKNVPIATTEDGVEVLEGTSVAWVINGKYCYDLPLHSLHLKTFNLGGKVYKIFSTRELAEEYILINKPCLSINDLGMITYGTLGDGLINKLKEIVKSKL